MQWRIPQRHPTSRKGGPGAAVFSDCLAVAEAAQALGVKEFDFFRLAFRRWFGRQPDEKQLEKYFAAYMFGRVVPSWARHLSRQVVDQRRNGMLDPEAFGAGRYRDRPTRHPKGPIYVAGLIALWLFLFSILLGTRYDPETSAPPAICTGETGAYFFEAWANLLSGRPAPPCSPGSAEER